ncbi:MAG: hypothetical protein KGP35_01480 [Bacteroidetes bacterium]|nr:hypothetical protein [Bacteroidota bacterium]
MDKRLIHSYPASRYILDACLFIIFLTTSFDTALNLKISGFSIRICTLLMVVFSGAVFLLSLAGYRPLKIRFLGWWSFLVWFIMLIVFLQNSILITRGIGYMVWLLIYLLFILSLTVYIDDYPHFFKILKYYLFSFIVISFFGLLQLVAGIFNINLFLEYYFLSGIPRIHGFSYEPSYFSTYLFVAWGFHFVLFFSDYKTLKNKLYNNFSLLLLSILIFISFSRMAIFFMFLLLLAKFGALFLNSIIRLRVSVINLTFSLALFFVTFLIVGIAVFNFNEFISVFEGLPFLSRYSHSAWTRIGDFESTLQIFINSPVKGYSLGGIAPAIAQLRGFTTITQEVVKQNEGLSIFMEVLAASGIFGFIFFVGFMYRLLSSGRILKKWAAINPSLESTEQLKIHHLLIVALIFQLLLLCLNQNILRNYLWVHIALINVSFFVAKKSLVSKRSAA